MPSFVKLCEIFVPNNKYKSLLFNEIFLTVYLLSTISDFICVDISFLIFYIFLN